MTRSIAGGPESPRWWEIGFVQGNPVSLNGEMLDPVSLVRRANEPAGTTARVSLDITRNRVVGIKSREIYETPGCCC